MAFYFFQRGFLPGSKNGVGNLSNKAAFVFEVKQRKKYIIKKNRITVLFFGN